MMLHLVLSSVLRCAADSGRVCGHLLGGLVLQSRLPPCYCGDTAHIPPHCAVPLWHFVSSVCVCVCVCVRACARMSTCVCVCVCVYVKTNRNGGCCVCTLTLVVVNKEFPFN